MDVTISRQGPITIMAVQGQVDGTTSKELESSIAKVISDGGTRILIDFTELDYISSAGLRILLMTGKKLKSGGAFALCSMRPNIQEVFDVSGFSRILTIRPDRDAALAALA